MVQPQTAATEGGYLAPGVADKAVKRRVSRVAMQEIEEEKKQAKMREQQYNKMIAALKRTAEENLKKNSEDAMMGNAADK